LSLIGGHGLMGLVGWITGGWTIVIGAICGGAMLAIVLKMEPALALRRMAAAAANGSSGE